MTRKSENKKLFIIFECSIFERVSHIGGIFILYKNLFNYLKDNKIRFLVIVYSEEIKNKFTKRIHPNIRVVNKRLFEPFRLFEIDQYIDNISVRKNKLIYHSTYYRKCLSNNYNIKSVVVVHDFIFENTTSMFKKFIIKYFRNLSIFQSSKIICISRTTFELFKKFYPKQLDNATMIYNGISNDFLNVKFNKKKLKFFLAIGSVSKYKNTLLILKLAYHFPDYIFIIVIPSIDQFKRKFKINKFPNNIKFETHIDTKKLISFYQKASAFLFLSDFEGYGLPALEAMSSGCPVVYLKDNKATTEIVNYRGFSTTKNIHDIVLTINKAIKAKPRLLVSNMNYAKRFSWQSSFGQYLSVYNSLK